MLDGSFFSIKDLKISFKQPFFFFQEILKLMIFLARLSENMEENGIKVIYFMVYT